MFDPILLVTASLRVASDYSKSSISMELIQIVVAFPAVESGTASGYLSRLCIELFSRNRRTIGQKIHKFEAEGATFSPRNGWIDAIWMRTPDVVTC